VDVGANVGGASIFFAKNGAERVYAYEPNPSAYRLLKINIAMNQLDSKIRPYREAVGNPNATMLIVSDSPPNTFEVARNGQNGIPVNVIGIDDIVVAHQIQDSVLNMDCEGAEYDAFSCASITAIRRFKEILVEFHYGADTLQEKLVRAGFRTEIWKPQVYMLSSSHGDPHLRIGMLHATRLDL